METFYIKEGDTSPAIRYELFPPTVDLTGASVMFQMRNLPSLGGATLINASAAVVIAKNTPTVEYSWQTGNSSGVYEAEFDVTYADGKTETFPNDEFILIKVSKKIQ
jgi:hypothetical protein